MRVAGVRLHGAQVGQPDEQPVQHTTVGAKLDARERWVVVAFADLERRDRVLGAGFDDLVEHARKDQRVDDVPAELDDLGVHA